MSKVKTLLTELELELMTLIWPLGEVAVADVLNALPKDCPLAPTTVSTMLLILKDKNVLSCRKEGRGHLYSARITKAEYEAFGRLTTLSSACSKVSRRRSFAVCSMRSD